MFHMQEALSQCLVFCTLGINLPCIQAISIHSRTLDMEPCIYPPICLCLYVHLSQNHTRGMEHAIDHLPLINQLTKINHQTDDSLCNITQKRPINKKYLPPQKILPISHYMARRAAAPFIASNNYYYSQMNYKQVSCCPKTLF